jgi:pimeloyl-ACP methyl ester carboxylesterase
MPSDVLIWLCGASPAGVIWPCARAERARRGMCGRLPTIAGYRSSIWRRGIGHGRRVRGSENHWLLLHGTPLTPAVWDGVAACLTRSGTVFAPAITPAGDARDAQGALAARLTTEVARSSGRLHVVGHSFGGQVATARYDRAGRTASIQIPATLIAAELDQVSAPAAMSALASRLPRATLQILPGASHMTPFTDPAALAEHILRAARR